MWHAAQAAHGVAGVHGFEPPSLRVLAAGLRFPRDHEEDKTGWQHEASSRIEQEHRESLFRVLAEPERTLLRAQGDSGAGVALQTCGICFFFRIDPALFRVLLLRRLRLPLRLSVRSCWCGRPFDSRGHRRAACARAGVLGRRCFAVESAAARICREGGARVTTNSMVRDMDLAALNPGDARRLEIVADGLPLFGCAQLAIDTTMISTLLTLMAWRSRLPGGGKSARIRSWSASEEGAGWWCLPANCAVAGPPRHRPS